MKIAGPLHAHADAEGVSGVRMLKVVSRAEAIAGSWPIDSVCVLSDDGARAEGAGVRIILRHGRQLLAGDVIRVTERASLISFLFRRGSNANTLLVTEQCNSSCLMCSQPPRDEDDRWRLDELKQAIRLIDRDICQLGFTGGEPTLFGHAFADVLDEARNSLPTVPLHILTNGRNFRDPELAARLVQAGGRQACWAVPLYADTAALHDEIVGAEGAFEETIEGLYHLALHKARVEIRVVLHALSVPRLFQLAAYIYRRMPFVEHVTLMGLEPMGFARRNRARLWIDPVDYAPELTAAVIFLGVRGLNVSIYNLPLCVLPLRLHRFARASISDWKNVAAEECATCDVAGACAGFFRSAGPQWRSRGVRPLRAGEYIDEMA